MKNGIITNNFYCSENVQLRDFVAKKITPYTVANDESSNFNQALVNEMFSLGLLNCITPSEYDGPGLRVSKLIEIARELGYGSAGVAATFIGNLLGYSPLVLYGSSDLKKNICSSFMKEYRLWSFGMTERAVGSDLVNLKTKAEKVSGGYSITGQKNFITNANYATDICLFANLQGKGISCFYVPGKSKGLTRGISLTKLGWRESNTGYIHFENVFVPDDHLLGEPGCGLQVLTHCLNRSKTLLGAVAVGVSLRALDLVQSHLLETERFGKSLLDQSAIRHILARLHTKVEASWLLVKSAADVWDSKKIAIKEASMAKMFAATTAVEVTSQAVELFGARGYMADNEVSKLFRDAKGIEIVEGPTLVQELLVAKEILPPTTKAKNKTKDLFRVDRKAS